ncbi:MAG TPA: ABC transporter permease [Vicinamibacterales bacterium]|nr:ABC transporter permease [Vicinamibacterales bacterium]
MPEWRTDLRRRLAPLRLPAQREQEIVDELVDDLDDRYRERRASGASEAEAERLAREALDTNEVLRGAFARAERPGDLEPIVPGGGGRAVMGTIWQDVTYGFRALKRNWGVTAVAVSTLALGIGANSAIFGLLNAVTLRSLPVVHPESLTEIRIAERRNATGQFSGLRPNLTYPLWEKISAGQTSFSGVVSWGNTTVNLTAGGQARYVRNLWVSGTYFPVLGVTPELGRLFGPADDQRNCQTPGLVLSYPFWQREFAGDRQVVGKTLRVEGHVFEIIGVAPQSFFGMEVGRSFDLSLPVCAEQIIGGEQPLLPRPDAWWLAAMGRLKPGVSAEQAASELQGLSAGIFQTTLPTKYSPEDAKSYLEFKLSAFPSPSGVSGLRTRYENPLWILLGITGLVLVIACANLANLLLARASARAREMAVRLALGASRRRLVRQLLVESLLLSMVGALAGVAVAQAASRALVALLDAGRNIIFVNLQSDWRVLAFTAGLGVLTCLLFGLAPALRASRTAPGVVLKAAGRGLTADRSRFGTGRVLVATQVALSLVLIVGALLFVRTLRNLTTLDPGFRAEGVLSTQVDMQPLNLALAQRAEIHRRVLERVAAVPGVESAAEAMVVPVSGNGWNERVLLGTDLKPAGISDVNRVSEGFFNTFGMTILTGRDFTARDTTSSPRVAIVNEAFVREILQGDKPIGTTFAFQPGTGDPVLPFEIVGLVRDTKYRNLRETSGAIAYISEAQAASPEPYTILLTRSSVPPATLIGPITRALAEVSPAMIVDFDVLTEQIAQTLVLERLMATLAGFFGALAGLLSVIGLYGILSYMVARRRSEIGIRMALGADRRAVIVLIVREAARLLAIGLVIGAILAAGAARTAQSLLFGLEPSDPATFAAGVLALAMVAVLAAYLPARRAARLDPLVALRED